MTGMSRTVLVTGGSRGIGRAIVLALAAPPAGGTTEGWEVAFTYRTDAAAARAVEEETGGRARAFALDLADRSRPDDLVAEVEAALPPIGGLVNNAGLRRESLLALTSIRAALTVGVRLSTSRLRYRPWGTRCSAT